MVHGRLVGFQSCMLETCTHLFTSDDLKPSRHMIILKENRTVRDLAFNVVELDWATWKIDRPNDIVLTVSMDFKDKQSPLRCHNITKP